jgi:hypothetical protein
MGFSEQFCDLLFEETILSFELIDFHLKASIVIYVIVLFLVAMFETGVELE